MLDLSASETIVFALIVLADAVAAVLCALQLLKRPGRYGALLMPLVLAAVLLDAALLGLRGVSIKAVPLTGLFDSLILLALVFGVLYLLLRFAVDQVWFGAVMVWVILGIVLMAALVAEPASRVHEVAGTPWAVAHASAMILAAASVLFAAANSALYLLGSYRLKHKGIMQVLGRMPSMETLGRMNGLGVRIGFVLLTLGVISGLGLASLVGPGVAKWLADGKVVCIIGAWGLLGAALILDSLHLLKAKTRAYMTIAAFGLILLAIIGVTIAGVTQHEFSRALPAGDCQLRAAGHRPPITNIAT